MKKYKKVKFWKDIDPQFRIFMSKRARLDDYINVYMFDTNDEMYKWCAKYERGSSNNDYDGRTFMFCKVFVDKDGNIKGYAPLNGYIAFSMEGISVSVLAHEVSHAVIGYFERKLKDPYSLIDDKVVISARGNSTHFIENKYINYEELFCYMVGNIEKQIIKFLYDLFTYEG